jgi:hypothetical protein
LRGAGEGLFEEEVACVAGDGRGKEGEYDCVGYREVLKRI